MRIRYLNCLITIVLLCGCSKSGPELAPVSGHVTLNGQPLENADVTFQPDEAKSPSVARTDKDGHYELGYKRGVLGGLVGRHTVRITVSPEVVRNAPHLAPQFNTQSTLTREVKAGEDNVFDFDVTTKPK
jgi:hypothetical protein